VAEALGLPSFCLHPPPFLLHHGRSTAGHHQMPATILKATASLLSSSRNRNKRSAWHKCCDPHKQAIPAADIEKKLELTGHLHNNLTASSAKPTQHNIGQMPEQQPSKSMATTLAIDSYGPSAKCCCCPTRLLRRQCSKKNRQVHTGVTIHKQQHIHLPTRRCWWLSAGQQQELQPICPAGRGGPQLLNH
jgi:hypothetical protein